MSDPGQGDRCPKTLGRSTEFSIDAEDDFPAIGGSSSPRPSTAGVVKSSGTPWARNPWGPRAPIQVPLESFSATAKAQDGKLVNMQFKI